MTETETALIHCADCKNTVDGCPRCGGPFLSPVSDLPALVLERPCPECGEAPLIRSWHRRFQEQDHYVRCPAGHVLSIALSLAPLTKLSPMEEPMAEATMSGVDLIATARAKHAEKGWTTEHDDVHSAGELAMAAACYAAPERIYVERRQMRDRIVLADPWPFPAHSDRSGRGSYDWDKRKHGGANFVQDPETQDRLELLVAAGALIAAEIDRLQRRSATPRTQPDPKESHDV